MSNNVIETGSLYTEIEFSFSRSSGPGGQNVNKVNSRVELRFDVMNSEILTEWQKDKINKKLHARINNEGILHLSNQDERSQLKNKEIVLKNFYKLINKALFEHKKRIKTKPSKESVEKRLKSKKENSEKKQRRKQGFD